MVDFKHEITSKQLLIYVLSTQLGFEILRLPSIIAQKVGHDGWISVLLTLIPSSLFILIVMALPKRYKGKILFDINNLLYGKIIGGAINVFIILYALLTASMVIRMYTELVYLTGLKLTPPIFISIIICIPSIILLRSGLQAIARFSGVILIVISFSIIYCILNFPKMAMLNLMPVGKAGFLTIFKGMGLVGFATLGFEFVPVIYPYVVDKEKALASVLLANLVNLLFLMLIVIVTTTIFGETMLSHLVIPLLSLARIYYSEIIERTDAYFIMIWFMDLLCVLSGYIFVAIHGFNKVFNISHKGISLISFFLIGILFSRIPQGLNDVYSYLDKLDILGYGIIIYLTFSYGFSFINKRGVERGTQG